LTSEDADLLAAGGQGIDIALFDGSLEVAAAIRSVAIDAFNSDAYPSPNIIAERLARPAGRVWLATEAHAGRVAGFLSVFETHSLCARRTEFDLLAVRKDARGRGIGMALTREAVEHWRTSGVSEARTLIRQGNIGSERVFKRMGFSPSSGLVELLTRPARDVGIQPANVTPEVRPAIGKDLPDLTRRWPALIPDLKRAGDLLGEDGFGLLLARDVRGIRGFIELLAVHTIAYSGAWLESFVAADDDVNVLSALAMATGSWAAGRQLEVAGALIDVKRETARHILEQAGYQPVGRYRFYHLSR